MRWQAMSLAGLVLALGAAPAPGQTRAELVSRVREAETAFAQTMSDRDMEAFRSFVADDAVFLGTDRVLRGADEVAAGWAPYFEGDTAPFSWRPEQVEVLESGALAHSSGPVRDRAGRIIGTFNSIWRLDRDGRWRVVFDRGCAACDCEAKP